MLRTEQEAPYMDSHSNPAVLDDERQAAAITPPPPLPPATPRKALLLIGLVVLLLVIGGLIAMAMRIHDGHVLARETERESIPTVAVVHPAAQKPSEELILPGTLRHMKSRPSMPAPMAIFCTGTRTSAAALPRANCLLTLTPP